MHHRPALWSAPCLFMLLALALAGCDANSDASAGQAGGAAAAGDGAPAGDETAVDNAAVDQTAASCDAAWDDPDPTVVLEARRESLLQGLHWEVGRFVDGTTPVFTGSFRATDMRGGWDSEHGDGEVDTVDAVAFIEAITWPEAGTQLVMVDLETGRAVALRQLESTSSTTDGSLVSDCAGSSYSFPSSCEGCVPALDPDAETLQLDELVLPGTWFNGGQQADLTVELQLARLDPADLTLAHLQAIGGAGCESPGWGGDYTLTDGVLSAPVESWWSADVASPGCSVACDWDEAYMPDGVSTMGGCGQEVGFEAEVYIHLDDPDERGVRAPVLEEPYVCCSYADPCGGAALFSRCWPE